MPLLWLSLAFLLGILLGDWTHLPVAVWLALALTALVFALLLWLSRRNPGSTPSLFRTPTIISDRFPSGLHSPIPYSLLFVVLALGAARYQLSLPEIGSHHIAWYNDLDGKSTIEGLVDAMPDERDEYTNLRVRVEDIRPPDELLFIPVEGTLLARVPPGGGWRYGDKVRLWGYLETPGENEVFSYREYLFHKGIYSQFDCGVSTTSESARMDCARRIGRDQGSPFLARLYDLRLRSLDLLYELFPDPEASLLAGILLGIESGIPADVAEAFIVTGTSHIIVISGFNFAIIAGLLAIIVTRWLGRWRGMLVAMLGIALYAVFVGGGAAVVRAAIMGGLAVFAAQIGRRQNGLNSLVFVAVLMALANPHALWDVGFQLSFAATLGLILFADRFMNAFVIIAAPHVERRTAQRLAAPVGEYLLFTLAAQLTTLPVILYHFQRLSLISLIANPLILPAQPPVMILGGITVLLGLLSQPAGQLAGYLTWPFVAYTIRLVEWLSKAAVTTLSVEFGALAVILSYTLIFAWAFAGDQLRRLWARLTGGLSAVAGWLLLALAVLAVVTWQVALATPDGRLHMTVLDVGSGDAVLIQTPTGRHLLIDGGPSPSKLSDSLGRSLPLGFRKLDYLVVAAASDDQIGALPATLRRFPPAEVLWAGPPAGTFNARELRKTLLTLGVPISTAQTGQLLNLGGGALLRVLAVQSKGAVLSLEWENFRALLPVGLNFESMEELLADHNLGAQTALLLAESGHAPLNTPEWIEKWHPQVILLSVGVDDHMARPDAETLQAVEDYHLLRTDENGWIKLSTDGRQFWVEVKQP